MCNLFTIHIICNGINLLASAILAPIIGHIAFLGHCSFEYIPHGTSYPNPSESRMSPHMPHFSKFILNDSSVFSSYPIDGGVHLRSYIYVCRTILFV